MSKPELSGSILNPYDTGVIDKYCACPYQDGLFRTLPDRSCHYNKLKCPDSGCPGEKCSHNGPHMICDLKGNLIEWNDLKSGMMVKIRTLHRHWPGYEYLYASVNGRYLYISLNKTVKFTQMLSIYEK